MTKLQEQMLLKIALNPHTVVDGQEPNSCIDTLVLESYVIESPIDTPVFNSLLKFDWVFNDGGLIGLTELGFEVFVDL
ncbi:MAG: hypothetical protein PHG08_00845 [Bacilli bacterium]|nr:hypothetical protein [Bacilli bacterium]